jgi:hypothetical protein
MVFKKIAVDERKEKTIKNVVIKLESPVSNDLTSTNFAG